MTFSPGSFKAQDLLLELMDPGTIQPVRLFRHPGGAWDPPPVEKRTARVDPPLAHRAEFAMLYAGSTLAAAAVECRILSLDPLDRWVLNETSQNIYKVARYTINAPGLFIPIDGPNRKTLGLSDLPLGSVNVYNAYQATSLQLYTRFGQLAHGLCWESFHRNQPGRVFAIWHHRKASLELALNEGSGADLKDDPEWVELIKVLDSAVLKLHD